MKVNEILKNYKIADKVKDGGINFLREHIKTTYVPYIEKMSRCELLLRSCWYRTDPETGIRRLAVNSPNLHVMFKMEFIRMYTDIELDYDGTKIVDNYDDLNKTGILRQILSLIPRSEIEEFKMIFQMTKDDLMTNEYEMGAYIKNRVNDIATIVGNLIIPALENSGFTKQYLSTLLSSPEVKNFISTLHGNKQ